MIEASPQVYRTRIARSTLGLYQRTRSGRLAERFVLLEIACQLALLWNGIGPLRIVVRIAVFAASLAFLVLVPGRARFHPSVKPALCVLALVALSIAHPSTNSILAGTGQIALYLAILAPLFWMPGLRVDLNVMRRVLLLIFAFQTLSAAVGVLQVYYPGQFQPQISSVVLAQGPDRLRSLQVKNAAGQLVFRPMGLTDVPGGASMAGFYAVLLSVGFFLTTRRRRMRALCVGTLIVGLMSIYLSQVRSVLVMLVVCLLAFIALLGWQSARLKRPLKVLRSRPKFQLASVTAMVAASALIALSWATAIGGKAVTERLATLTQAHAGEVYYQNRGRFLDYTVTELLPEYPLGAGLGRWGMISHYFGDRSNWESPPIWVEIQWTGWLLDGGVPLIMAYMVALAVAFKVSFKIASERAAPDLAVWGALIFAYNLAAVADTFAYPFFIGQTGLDFWLLNAMLYSAAHMAYQAEHNGGRRLA